MQTIFRAQTPYVFDEDGIKKYKANCYVFDFAPDRSLRMLAETAKFSTLTQKQKLNAKNVGSHDEDIQKMKDFLKFCPVISLDGTMKEFNAERLFTQLNQVYIDRVVRNGFNDNSLYDVQALLDLDVDNLNALGDTIAKSSNLDAPPKAKSLPPEVQMTSNGLNGKGKKEQPTGDDDTKTDENEEEKKRKKARRDERDRRIKIIRGLALRVPLMMFGAEVTSDSEEITRENFTKKIDDKSWEEFMPRGVTKADFNSIKTAFNQTIFTGAGKKIRQLARQADDMTVTERIQRITEIFGYFHNPDKETVLTPWRVVNMHMSDTIGGYCFFNESFTGSNQVPRYMTGDKLIEYVDTNEPRFVNREGVTDKVFFDREKGSFDLKSKILEINSKTGLYPLYVAYTLFRARKADFENLGLIEDTSKYSVEEEQAIWDDILLDNIYVVCNTPMAACITKRTLVGFRDVSDDRVNIKSIKLVEEATTNQDALVKKLNSEKFWFGKGTGEMKFNAIVGNPPYQVIKGDGRTGFASAVYPYFLDVARSLCQGCVSMIMPSRWMTKTGQGVSEKWCDDLIRSNHFVCMFDFHDAKDCFPGVEIKGGVCYFLYNGDYSGKCRYSIRMLGKDSPSVNFLDEYGAGIVVRDVVARKIVDRVRKLEGDYFNNNSFASYVGPVHLFDKDGQLGTGWKGFSDKKDSSHCIKYYLNRRIVERGFGWIKRTDIPKGEEVLPLHKVYIPEAYGAGEGFPHQILGVPFYGEPNSVCSETYLAIGYDQIKHKLSKKECENIVSYIKTRFFRFMVYVKKRTQHAVAAVYQFVPLQDFTEKSDIDWSRPVEDINQQIYDKYRLSKPERDFIDKMIKPME